MILINNVIPRLKRDPMNYTKIRGCEQVEDGNTCNKQWTIIASTKRFAWWTFSY
jgi:hypothetical protein